MWDSGNVNGLQDLTATRVAGFPKHRLWEGGLGKQTIFGMAMTEVRDARFSSKRSANVESGHRFPDPLCFIHFIVQYSILFIALCAIAVNCTALLVFASHSIALNSTYFITLRYSALHFIALRSTLLNGIGLL